MVTCRPAWAYPAESSAQPCLVAISTCRCGQLPSCCSLLPMPAPLVPPLQATSIKRAARRLAEKKKLFESGAMEETVRCAGLLGLVSVA